MIFEGPSQHKPFCGAELCSLQEPMWHPLHKVCCAEVCTGASLLQAVVPLWSKRPACAIKINYIAAGFESC